MEELIAKIKEKPSLHNLSNEFIKKHIDSYLTSYHPDLTKKAEKTKLIKYVRRKINIAFGMFQTKKINKLPVLLEQLKHNPNSLELHNQILATNKSTLERLPFYSEIYKKILNKEKSILDIGCGLNPFSYPYMNKKITYYAYDLYTQPIQEYFNIKKIKGEAKDIDLGDQKNYTFPKTDICFLFKVLDSLEKKVHKKAERLIKSIPAKKIVVSFPLKTLKNKVMTTQERNWLKRMTERLNYSLDHFKTENEIFYIIRKK